MQNPVLRSLLTAEGELRLFFDDVDVGQPETDEVVVAMQAAPVNPSDLGTLLGAADLQSAARTGTGYASVTTANVPERAMRGAAARIGRSLPVGNEGAGTVVAVGSGEAATALMGRPVACLPGGGSFGRFVRTKASSCLLLPDGIDFAAGAAALVNPMTAVVMLETMRVEGHTALVHTAAASNLGRMLSRLCAEEGVGLVNVVRSGEQAALLRSEGAAHVVVSTAPDFGTDLAVAIGATGASICFDAIGGGRLLGQVLAAMEACFGAAGAAYNRYGSTTHKQGYVYGVLDPAPTELPRSIGFAWNVGGWLLLPTLDRLGPATTARLRDRVSAGLRTTFGSSYARRITLSDILDPENIRAFGSRSTGGKFLLMMPHHDER